MRLVAIDGWANTPLKDSEEGGFFGASHFYSDVARPVLATTSWLIVSFGALQQS
jgi:hypothetical protein